MSVIRTELTKTETYQATRQVHDTTTYTITLSEREAVLVAYLLGRAPIGWGDRLYDELRFALPVSTHAWPGTISFLSRRLTSDDADKIAALLEGFSDRRE